MRQDPFPLTLMEEDADFLCKKLRHLPAAALLTEAASRLCTVLDTGEALGKYVLQAAKPLAPRIAQALSYGRQPFPARKDEAYQ